MSSLRIIAAALWMTRPEFEQPASGELAVSMEGSGGVEMVHELLVSEGAMECEIMQGDGVDTLQRIGVVWID